VVQADKQIVFDVAFVCGLKVFDVTTPFGSCEIWAEGRRQAVWQLAACALHAIMQFVAVELCASRILPLAIDDDAQAQKQSVAASRNAIKPRMSRLRCRNTIARHAGRAKAKLRPSRLLARGRSAPRRFRNEGLFLCGLDVVAQCP
jgi:hypothetical protein